MTLLKKCRLWKTDLHILGLRLPHLLHIVGHVSIRAVFQFFNFVTCLESGEDFLVSPQDGLEALRVALAATESLRTGRPVDVAMFKKAVSLSWMAPTRYSNQSF